MLSVTIKTVECCQKPETVECCQKPETVNYLVTKLQVGLAEAPEFEAMSLEQP